MPYVNIGVAKSVLRYENSWMEYFDANWKQNQTFLKLTTIDFAQWKHYGSDGMHNSANNTNPDLGGEPYHEMIMYWNFY